MATIEEWAARTPDGVALVSGHGDRTFAELDARANRLARALLSAGLAPGDAVALVCGNRPEFAEVVYGCQRAGLRLTPVNWHLTADEVAYIVRDCEARALIAEVGIDAAVAALDLAPDCTVGFGIGGGAPGLDAYEDRLGAEPADAVEGHPVGGTMLYTSGTTGRPKGVHRPGETPSSSTVNLGGYCEDGGDTHLCTGPLYHAAPLAFSLRIPLSMGAGVVLMERWDAADALRLIDAHGVTHTHMVPTMFHRLLGLPAEVRDRYAVGTLRHVLHGAAPCPVEEKRRMIEWFGPVISEYYAATEGMGSLVDSATWLAHPGTVGRPFGEDQVIVGDEDGRRLPAGEIGLVYLRSPAATRFEYFKDEDKTRAAFRGDYFTLGDVGYLDADGYLFLTDRSANLIISGGVNIYPAEVDEVLLGHPAVGDVATIGVPDEEWGEVVVAVVETTADSPPSTELAAELIEFARERLAHYKCPRRVEFTPELPRSDNGKIYKRRLREQYRQT